MKKSITRISNNEEVDISKLSIEELYKLHFEEEKYVASKLKEFPAFSNERIDLLDKAYKIINPIREYRKVLENKDLSVDGKNKLFEYNLFKKVLKKMNKRNLTVLELGSGEGILLNKISLIPNLKVYGCDLNITNLNKEINIIEDSIFNTLKKFEDDSIDILIADNVCEHFFKDEADVIYELIYKKLSKEGKIIFLIPNRYIGPSDISKKFLKQGEEPVGFHFMEQTYKENMELFNKHNLYTDYLVIRLKIKSLFIKNILKLDNIKIFFEKIIGNLKIKFKIKKAIMDHLGYRVYILKK